MSSKENQKLAKENRTFRKAKNSAEKFMRSNENEDSRSQENMSKSENVKDIDDDNDSKKEIDNMRTHNANDKSKEEDTNASNDNERKSSIGGEDYQLNEKVKVKILKSLGI